MQTDERSTPLLCAFVITLTALAAIAMVHLLLWY